MNIYTSTFNDLNNIPKGFKAICISQPCPNAFDGPSDADFIPSLKLLGKYKHKKRISTFETDYKNEVLDKLDITHTLINISCLAENNDNVILVTYSKPIDELQRNAICKWFKSYGIECVDRTF